MIHKHPEISRMAPAPLPRDIPLICIRYYFKFINKRKSRQYVSLFHFSGFIYNHKSTFFTIPTYTFYTSDKILKTYS